MNKLIVVIGCLNTDFVVKGDRLPMAGESVVGSEFYQAFGGKGANQAVGIARLGVNDVRFVAGVGDDRLGNAGIASLEKEGIDCSTVRRVPNAASGVALIMLDSAGENCIMAAPGANSSIDEEYVLRNVDSILDGCGFLVICQEIPVESIHILVTSAKQKGIRTLFNPAPPNFRLVDSGVLGEVEFLTPNETETEAITGIDVSLESSLDQAGVSKRRTAAISRLLQLGVQRVAITLGKEGCLVFDSTIHGSPEYAVLIEAPKVTAVDTTAAGDSFNAALAVALHEGKTFLESCRWANQVASISVTRKGAQPSLPFRGEVEISSD